MRNNNNNNNAKENSMIKIDTIHSTYNGGYSANLWKGTMGYRVDIQYDNKTYVYYCTNDADCYTAISNLTK